MICDHCLESIGATHAPSHLTRVASSRHDASAPGPAVEHYQCGDCGTTFVHQPAFGATTLAWLMGSATRGTYAAANA